jgi:DNA-binding response OmpR family regulator
MNKPSPPQLELLLIEDDDIDALAIRRAIRALDRPVALTAYATGDHALRDPRLAADRAGPPPLVILDLNLPGMGGLSFLRRLRSNGHRAGTPVVVLTTSSDERDRATALGLHAAGYFIKPVDGTRLRGLIAMLVEYWSHSLGIDRG